MNHTYVHIRIYSFTYTYSFNGDIHHVCMLHTYVHVYDVIMYIRMYNELTYVHNVCIYVRV